ncbi:MAG: ATP-binding protein [Streptosporangiaceae bacterium]
MHVFCPELIGRESEVRTLKTAFDAAHDWRGGVLVLSGEAGVGKTRLAREAAAHASERGWEVVTARAVESAQLMPLQPIVEALTDTERDGEPVGLPAAAELGRHRISPGPVVPGEDQAPSQDDGTTPLTRGDAVIRLLSRMRGDTGTLLVLDDLHLADPETLALLEYLADHLRDQKALCIATLRWDEPSRAAALIRGLHSRQAITMVQVSRLSAEHVEQMAVASLGGRSVPADGLTRILARCDGLPFAVEEVLAAAVTSGELVLDDAGWHVNQQTSAGATASIISSVRQRLAGLSPDVVDVLTTAAVLGSQFDLNLLTGLAGISEQAVLRALDLAADLQLLEPRYDNQEVLSFRHGLIRDAIVSGLLPPERAARSRRAAAAIERAHPDLSGSWCELAIDMHQAAGAIVRAAELQLELGRRALQRGALASATAVLTEARNLLEPSPSAPDRLVVDIDNAIVRAIELTGDTIQLIPAADRLIAGLDRIGADQMWKAHVHVRMARAFAEDRPGTAAEHLAMARAIADSVQDMALSARLDAVAARCALDAQRPDAAVELASRSLAAAEAAGLRSWAGETAYEALETIGRLAQLRGDLGTAAAAFERAYEIATTERRPVLRIRALRQIGMAQMLESGATSKLSEARDLAAHAGAISAMALIDLQLATAWSLRRDLERPLTLARSCQQTAGRIRQRRVGAMSWCVQGVIAGLRRDRDATERAAVQAEMMLPDDPEVLFVAWADVRTSASLFLDDISRAHAESNTGISYGRKARQHGPQRAWAFWALLEVIGGDGQAALHEAQARAAVGSFNCGFLAYADAVLKGRAGDPERATELAERASGNLAPFAPWWNHLAQRLVAPYALEHGWGQPAEWLRGAIANFQEHGYNELASACRDIVRRAA